MSSSYFSENDSTNEIPEVPLPKYMKLSQMEGNFLELESLKEAKTKYSHQSLTPLESQVMDLKAKYPKLTLFVECGYRYRFFGEDAFAAAKVLDIALVREQKFLTASLPTFNGPMKYVRKFVEMGYKVGIVSQDQSSVSQQYGRNISRCVTEIYTRATLLSMDLPLRDSVMEEGRNEVLNSGIISILDAPLSQKTSKISIAYIDPKNGRLIHDEFFDSPYRNKLHARLMYFGVSDIIFDEVESTKETRDLLLNAFTDSNITIEPGHKWFEVWRSSLSSVALTVELEHALKILSGGQLPRCIGGLLAYLTEFGVQESLIKTGNIMGYNDLSRFMRLPSYTLHNLELFRTSSRVKGGSVFNFINQTQTKFGSRVLRSWLACPLLDKEAICRRQKAIEELILDESLSKRIYGVLYRMPDLELGLMSILNKRISPNDYYLFIREIITAHDFAQSLTQFPSSQLLKSIVLNIRNRFEGAEQYLQILNIEVLRQQPIEWHKIFNDFIEYPEVYRVREAVEDIQWSLEMHKSKIMEVLGEYSFEYSSVGNLDYLIEVKNDKKVPKCWIKMSSTKSTSRYRDPIIKDRICNLSLNRERLTELSIKAWKDFLSKLSSNIISFQNGVNSLGELDALLSLHKVSKSDGFVKPIFTESTFHVTDGRNPIVEQSLGLGSSFISNDILLDDKRTLILSGPNSGGKSTFLRQTGILTILAQMGSFVPAKRALIPIVDALFLRTGARDDLWNRKSTFYVELEETSDIIRGASSASLVLLDELGTGTSSYDGLSFAESVLSHLSVTINSYTIFVTHYGALASGMEKSYPGRVQSAHMGYSFQQESPILLYKVVPGGSTKSYGINVAERAGLPSDVLQNAARLSRIYEKDFSIKHRLICLMQEYYVNGMK